MSIEDSNAQSYQCLINLRLTDPELDKERIESTKGMLLKESSAWIFLNKDFRKWRENQDGRPLWLTGDAGKGKTMLLCHIVDELSNPHTRDSLVSYFFCQATDEKLNNATAVLRGLIYMLIKQDNTLLEYINAEVSLLRILGSLLQNRGSSKLVFIIDALDECSEGLGSFLKFVGKHSGTSQVKWLVSSRNLPHIEEALAQFNQLSLELNQGSISAAVGFYIQQKVDDLQYKKRFKNDVREKIISSLTEKAENTFLWVALVSNELENAPRRNLLAQLERFPASLDRLYKTMMDTINDSADHELFHTILAIISVVYRPISLLELYTLLGDS